MKAISTQSLRNATWKYSQFSCVITWLQKTNGTRTVWLLSSQPTMRTEEFIIHRQLETISKILKEFVRKMNFWRYGRMRHPLCRIQAFLTPKVFFINTSTKPLPTEDGSYHSLVGCCVYHPLLHWIPLCCWMRQAV